jgi:amino acid permease
MGDYEKDVQIPPGPTAARVEEGDIKRDLSSRHINMIAIAGMIVRNQVAYMSIVD